MNIILCLLLCIISFGITQGFRFKLRTRNRNEEVKNDDFIYYPSWKQMSIVQLMNSVTTQTPTTEPDFVPFQNELRSNLPPPPPPPQPKPSSTENDDRGRAIAAQVEVGEINPENCGRARELLVGGRVVGGRLAQNQEFPWQVAIMSKQNPKLRGEYHHVCGATILNKRWIITAAHCTFGVELSKIKGFIGTNDIKTFGEHMMQVYFDKVVIHKGYVHGFYNNDISLLHTTRDMPLFTNTTAINAVCLPSANQTAEGYATITGWGRINEEGPRTSRLRALDVPLQEPGPCQKAYPDIFHEQNMLCVGFVQGGKDSCQADSGGPLVVQENDKSYLLGIVSFGNGCARRRNPGVYTKVSQYIQWIKDNMNI